MSMVVQGRVHRFGDEVNTDVILPGRYLALRKPEDLGRHCMEGLDPDFIKRVRRGDILAVGRNFGCGSSREHAPIAIRACGVSCVIAPSFARIFYRNAINIGFPILECPEAAAEIANGDQVSVDFATGTITDETTGKTYHATAFPPFIQKIIAHGGLLSYLKARQQNAEAE